jgi:hypothetical protein
MNLGNIQASSSFVHDGPEHSGWCFDVFDVHQRERRPNTVKLSRWFAASGRVSDIRKGMPVPTSQKPFIVEIKRRRRRRPARHVDLTKSPPDKISDTVRPAGFDSRSLHTPGLAS